MRSHKAIVLYTDGACSSNGIAGNAKGGIGVYWPGQEHKNVSEPLHGRQTNQRAEIQAATRGIRDARASGYDNITIKTDSHYVRNAAESWIPNWEKNNWSTKVVNKTDFQDLRDSMKGAKVKFEYVPRNENAADSLAKSGAKRVGSNLLLLCRKLIIR